MGFLIWEITMSSFIQYIKDTRSELKHVSWPTRSQTIWFTVLVIVISLLTAVYLGAFDQLFTHIVKTYIIK
ncbi:MAG: preprotein translocase subunit SecE [Patescibacteria group bacterium]|jgi:preprotein translocase subunit SecE|nr:preprotein translocase subunit SecE [Patescibacteria group bacterium]